MQNQQDDTQPPKMPVRQSGEESDKKPEKTKPVATNTDFINRIIEKINKSENILVALSRNPSTDEIAAAIGLAMYLEELGKHTTAIYSGETPNVLEFLKPEETFETNTNSLQDFIVALNKEKADHLRYRIDGDYVKVYITPYKTTISQDDLEFSHGDYNVDLVIALNVPTASDLDAALSEHGRIMHDASAIDITTGEPGRFGEIEWSDQNSSSVGEMVANLLLVMKKPQVKKEVATALLTGMVSATNRFSNENTKPSTMSMAAKMMELGADQQLVALNVMENSPAELIGAVDTGVNSNEQANEPQDDTLLSIDHNKKQPEETPEETSEETQAKSEGSEQIQDNNQITEPQEEVSVQTEEQPVEKVESEENQTIEPLATEQAVVPPEPEPVAEEPPVLDYGKMMEEALEESIPEENKAAMPVPIQPITSENTVEDSTIPQTTADEGMSPTGILNESDAPQATGDDSYILDQPPKVIEPLPDLPPPPVPQADFATIPSSDAVLPPVVQSEQSVPPMQTGSGVAEPVQAPSPSDGLAQLQQLAQPAQAVEAPELPPLAEVEGAIPTENPPEAPTVVPQPAADQQMGAFQIPNIGQ